MRNSPTHWLFLLLVVLFIVLAVFNVLPFPVLAMLLLVSWCTLAVIVLIIQRRLSNQRNKKAED
ncbi:MAG: hypothetical protein HRU24_18825 [Gammaproteobacteria bacterium]|nr:hypothetical protein [Gammaproteobacteria bacterium]